MPLAYPLRLSARSASLCRPTRSLARLSRLRPKALRPPPRQHWAFSPWSGFSAALVTLGSYRSHRLLLPLGRECLSVLISAAAAPGTDASEKGAGRTLEQAGGRAGSAWGCRQASWPFRASVSWWATLIRSAFLGEAGPLTLVRVSCSPRGRWSGSVCPGENGAACCPSCVTGNPSHGALGPTRTAVCAPEMAHFKTVLASVRVNAVPR